MRQLCIQAVEGVLNRPISVAEAQNIEATIIRNMRALNRRDTTAVSYTHLTLPTIYSV